METATKGQQVRVMDYSYMSVIYREVEPSDIQKIKEFILLHGSNPWNHLPISWLEDHLSLVSSGRVQAVIGLNIDEIVGVVTFFVGFASHFNLGENFPKDLFPDEWSEKEGLCRKYF